MSSSSTIAEYGHGNRRGLLSDYTVAVREDGRLVTSAKPTRALTSGRDSRAHPILSWTTTHRRPRVPSRGRAHIGPRSRLNNVQKRSQHNAMPRSGFALRFPPIVAFCGQTTGRRHSIRSLRFREIFDSQHGKRND